MQLLSGAKGQAWV